MDPIGFIVTCLIVGIVLWLIVRFVPMPAQIKTLMIYGTVVILALWLVLGLLGMTHVGTVRIS